MKKIIQIAIIIILFLIVQVSFGQKTNYPDSFILQEDEIPTDYKIKTISDIEIAKGFQGNPGYLTNVLLTRTFTETQRAFFSKLYVAVYINEKTKEELVISVFKLHKANTYFDLGKSINQTLIKNDNLVVFSPKNDKVINAIALRNNMYKPKFLHFIGNINKKVYGIIQLEVNALKNGYKGVFLNTKTNKTIDLKGAFANGILQLSEYENGVELTGYFEGEMQENYLFGEWLSPDRDVSVGFVFKKSANLYDDFTHPKIQQNLTNITSAIKNHKWNKFISYCDQENYNTQHNEIGIARNQYIEEILNVNFDKKSINDIVDFKINRMEVAPSFLYRYYGILTLKDGTDYSFSFALTSDYLISGGVG